MLRQPSHPMHDDSTTTALRLGHITYSNCFPVHAGLVDDAVVPAPVLVSGVPSRLNRLLERGEIDVAPSSSIEYARHAGRYRIIPDFVIGSRGPVRSILLLSRREPRALEGRTVALPTASATSVVLLKILLRERWHAAPRFVWFDQAREDPFVQYGADAALFIGDVALQADLYPHLPVRLDLGAEWWAQTGLPFAFAVWQAAAGTDEQLAALHAALVASRAYGERNHTGLAARYAERFGLPAPFLDAYWRGLAFELDAEMTNGLTAFYQAAHRLGEIAAVPPLRWTPRG